MSTNRLHISIALGSPGRSGPTAQAHRAGRDAEPLARQWVNLVAQAERALVDFVTIEDTHRLMVAPHDRTLNGGRPPEESLDAIMIACRLAPATRHVGIVPMASTTLTEPFLLSSQIATLDHVSRGRAGWQLHVSTAPGDRSYVGPGGENDVDRLHREAVDHVEVVRRLWDSWDDDAEIRDAATHRFIDRRRLHYVDFDGPEFSVRGPSITPRPPQGQPIIATRAGADATLALALQTSDVLLLAADDENELAQLVATVREQAVSAGRDPDALRLLAEVEVVLEAERAEAIERWARLDARQGGSPRPGALALAGTPSASAEQLIAWSELGVDGFRLWPGELERDLTAISDQLTAELRSRRAFRHVYEANTLRGHLGLPRPASRYAAA